ncbi:protein of unknown function [Hyphomicrobium sp. MC1]|nr:protein of unknown function [Hyphomicrobium sp. MC1]
MRSATVVKVAQTIEAILKSLRPEELIACQVGAPGPSAPAKMVAGISIPLRTTETTAIADIGISLNLRDAGIDFAARAFAFDIATAIVLAEAEAEAAIIQPNGLRCGGPGSSCDDDSSQDDP